METGNRLQPNDVINIFKSDLKEAERLFANEDAESASKLLINASYSLIRNLDIEIKLK